VWELHTEGQNCDKW